MVQASYLKIFLAIIFVFALIIALSFLLRKLETFKNNVRNRLENRLGILETIYLGKGERIILMRKDKLEYLLLVTNNSSILIDKYSYKNSDESS